MVGPLTVHCRTPVATLISGRNIHNRQRVIAIAKPEVTRLNYSEFCILIGVPRYLRSWPTTAFENDVTVGIYCAHFILKVEIKLKMNRNSC